MQRYLARCNIRAVARSPKWRENRQHVSIVLQKTTEGAQEGFHRSDLEEVESNIEAQAMDHVRPPGMRNLRCGSLAYTIEEGDTARLYSSVTRSPK